VALRALELLLAGGHGPGDVPAGMP